MYQVLNSNLIVSKITSLLFNKSLQITFKFNCNLLQVVKRVKYCNIFLFAGQVIAGADHVEIHNKGEINIHVNNEDLSLYKLIEKKYDFKMFYLFLFFKQKSKNLTLFNRQTSVKMPF